MRHLVFISLFVWLAVKQPINNFGVVHKTCKMSFSWRLVCSERWITSLWSTCLPKRKKIKIKIQSATDWEWKWSLFISAGQYCVHTATAEAARNHKLNQAQQSNMLTVSLGRIKCHFCLNASLSEQRAGFDKAKFILVLTRHFPRISLFSHSPFLPACLLQSALPASPLWADYRSHPLTKNTPLT